MKYYNFTEHYALYELSFSKGLQYQMAMIVSEGGECWYRATEDELNENIDVFDSLIASVDKNDYLEGY